MSRIVDCHFGRGRAAMIALAGDRAPALCVLMRARQHCAAQPARSTERIGLGTADLARGHAKNNVRDSSGGTRSNPHMMLAILRKPFEETLAVNTILVFTLAVAATLNAWCLSAYL